MPGLARAFKILLVPLLLLVAAILYYGFVHKPRHLQASLNPVIAHEPYTITAEAAALHGSLRIADLHCDALLWNRNLLKENSIGHVDVPRMITGNVALEAFTVVTKTPSGQNYQRNSSASDDITGLAVSQLWPPSTWSSLLARARYQAEKLHDFAAESGGRLTVITTQAELADFFERRQDDPALVAGVLGIEGAHCIEEDIKNVQILYDLGYRTVGLTHFFDNAVGGSVHGEEQAGITEFGREVLAELEARHMIIDLAHASPELIDDVLAIASRPVYSSHTGIRGHCDSVRNLSDAHAKAIAQRGGLIGIGFWDTAACTPTPEGIAGAIRYAVDLAGVDHVALGSDYDGATEVPFDVSEIAALTQALLDAGFTENEIRAVMGENVIRFFQENLPEG